MTATIHERGNGFPDVGDYVPGSDGELYRLVRYIGPIHCHQGRANWIHAEVELADWDDVESSDVYPCSCILD